MDQLERMEDEQLRALPTATLVRQALAEAKLLAQAEVLHAKAELRGELVAAKRAGILIGAGLVFALSGLPLLFVALALALPIGEPLAAVLVGVGLLLLGAGLAYFGSKRIPRAPLPHTQQRLREDVDMARERLL